MLFESLPGMNPLYPVVATKGLSIVGEFTKVGPVTRSFCRFRMVS